MQRNRLGSGSFLVPNFTRQAGIDDLRLLDFRMRSLEVGKADEARVDERLELGRGLVAQTVSQQLHGGVGRLATLQDRDGGDTDADGFLLVHDDRDQDRMDLRQQRI